MKSAILPANLVQLGSMQMPEERTVNKVFRNIPDGRRAVGKPKRGGWTMLNDLKKMVLEVGGGGGGRGG